MTVKSLMRASLGAALLAAVVAAVPLLPAAADYPPTPSETAPTAPAPGHLDLGALTVMIDGVAVQVTQTATADAVTLSGDGWTITLGTLSTGGAPLELIDGHLVIPQKGGLALDISGFNPGTYAALYLYSNPLYLGSIKVDAKGHALGALAMPANAPAGPHTVQVVGTTETGDKLALALGVFVKPTSIPASATRFAIANVHPLAGAKWKIGATARMRVKLLRMADGRALTAANVKSLPRCAAKVRVTSVKTGRVLHGSTCMTISSTGMVLHNWKVPAPALGAIRVVFTIADTGRPTLTRTVLLKVVR